MSTQDGTKHPEKVKVGTNFWRWNRKLLKIAQAAKKSRFHGVGVRVGGPATDRQTDNRMDDITFNSDYSYSDQAGPTCSGECFDARPKTKAIVLLCWTGRLTRCHLDLNSGLSVCPVSLAFRFKSFHSGFSFSFSWNLSRLSFTFPLSPFVVCPWSSVVHLRKSEKGSERKFQKTTVREMD